MRVFSFAMLLTIATLPAAGAPMVADGMTDDWGAIKPVIVDARGDAEGKVIDFGRLWVASDEERVYLRFETGGKIRLQTDEKITLYVDTDNDTSTGLGACGIGADWSWRFCDRSGAIHDKDGSPLALFGQAACELRQEPTVSACDFEVAFSRDAIVKGTPLFPGKSITLALRDDGHGVCDQIPERDAKPIVHRLSDATRETVSPTPVARARNADFRLVSHNTLHEGLIIRPEPFGRLIEAADADIYCFQECNKHSANDARDLVAKTLGGQWYAAKNDSAVTVSRFPLLKAHVIEGGRNMLGALVDLPGTESDLYVINVHLPCCARDNERQTHVDTLVAWLRESRKAGSFLKSRTPIIVTGDMNFVGHERQPWTLLTGDILDEKAHGSDCPLDWDDSALADLMPRHVAGDEIYTWRNDNDKYPPGRLDYVFFTDSVMSAERSFALWTPTMTPNDLKSAGLQRDDAPTASDHIPLVVDFRLRSPREEAQWPVRN